MVDIDIRKRPIFFPDFISAAMEREIVRFLVVKTAFPLFSFLREIFFFSIALILRFKGLLLRSLLYKMF